MPLFAPTATVEELDAMIQQSLFNPEQTGHLIISDYNNTDPNSRTTLGWQTQQPDLILNELQMLKDFEGIIAILHGENDLLINRTYLDNLELNLWKDEVIVIKGTRHYPQIEDPDQFNDIFIKFIKDCSESVK